MGRTRDPRRPTMVNDDDLRTANESEEIISLVKTRAKALERCKERLGSAIEVKGGVEYTEYRAAQVCLQNTRRRLAQAALQDRRKRHDETVALEDVEEQLRGSLPVVPPQLVEEHLAPSSLRGRIVASLFADELPMPGTSEDAARRVGALTDLLELYNLESPHPKRQTTPSVCTNCATDMSCRWRRTAGDLLCSTCYAYHHKHGRPRPQELVVKSQVRASVRKCSNEACATDTTPQ
jgi:hypothetical protein